MPPKKHMIQPNLETVKLPYIGLNEYVGPNDEPWRTVFRADEPVVSWEERPQPNKTADAQASGNQTRPSEGAAVQNDGKGDTIDRQQAISSASKGKTRDVEVVEIQEIGPNKVPGTAELRRISSAPAPAKDGMADALSPAEFLELEGRIAGILTGIVPADRTENLSKILAGLRNVPDSKENTWGNQFADSSLPVRFMPSSGSSSGSIVTGSTSDSISSATRSTPADPQGSPSPPPQSAAQPQPAPSPPPLSAAQSQPAPSPPSLSAAQVQPAAHVQASQPLSTPRAATSPLPARTEPALEDYSLAHPTRGSSDYSSVRQNDRGSTVWYTSRSPGDIAEPPPFSRPDYAIQDADIYVHVNTDTTMSKMWLRVDGKWQHVNPHERLVHHPHNPSRFLSRRPGANPAWVLQETASKHIGRYGSGGSSASGV
ncbi:hypothetical protein PLICRDRAFT_176795 [Plicaturopsis crispa FD-325 SS-3]|nr:hypothetical protein PLICRDRAFT_176795 [Plicaturopsis crispa FD-325 SS-3]